MSANYFLDTNLFVYAFDQQAPEKQSRALLLIENALLDGRGIISTQVMQEFLNVATHKFAAPLTLSDRQQYVRRVLYPLCRVFPDLDLYEAALQIQAETGYSFYDSLILAGAVAGNCSVLYTEDLQNGRTVRGVHIQNPFADQV